MLLHPLCTALEFSDVLDLISSHYKESQHGTRRRPGDSFIKRDSCPLDPRKISNYKVEYL